jgi:CDP-diacylglycerol--serine O-phosphatidyltransferase
MPKYREIFPGTFTMLNAVCGYISILLTLDGEIINACWFIILAGFLDALDGKVARLSGVSSRFGIELDSLADFSSFGVAPAVLIYSLKLEALGKLGWIIITAIYIMAAGYRLAKFNLYADTEEKQEFVGLPVPAAALTLVSFIIFCHYLWGAVLFPEVVVSMIILFAFLMVSQVEYDTLPDEFNTFQQRIKLLVIIAAAVAVILKPRLVLFPFFGLYILLGMLRELYRMFARGVEKVTGRSNNKDENPQL